MDIYTHMLSGVAASTVVAALSRKDWKGKTLIVCLGALGGMFPDIDAYSKCSKMDPVFQSVFNIKPENIRSFMQKVYTGSHWYSHHMFFHSLLGGIVVSLMLFSLWYGVYSLFSKDISFMRFMKHRYIYLVALYTAFVVHLLGDLPTPDAYWDGIKLFWPLAPVGGTGHIMWFHNYDLFLITLSGCVINLCLLAVILFKSGKGTIRYIPAAVFACTLLLTVYQINHREAVSKKCFNRTIRFTKQGYNLRSYNKQALEMQKEILGETLFGYMHNRVGPTLERTFGLPL